MRKRAKRIAKSLETTPINCVSCACALVEAFDDAMGGLDPVVDSVADMAKSSARSAYGGRPGE